MVPGRLKADYEQAMPEIAVGVKLPPPDGGSPPGTTP